MPSSPSFGTEQQRQQQQQQQPARLRHCEECGDVDGDTRAGVAVCRCCADNALAQMAQTD